MMIRTPLTDKNKLEIIKYCQWLRRTGKLKSIPEASFDPSIVIKFDKIELSGSIGFVMFYNRRITGFIEFVEVDYFVKIGVLGAGTLLTPHCYLTYNLMRKGYTTFFYNLMLSNGYILVTEKTHRGS